MVYILLDDLVFYAALDMPPIGNRWSLFLSLGSLGQGNTCLFEVLSENNKFVGIGKAYIQ